MKYTFIAFAAALALAGCAEPGANGAVSQGAITAPTTVSALLAAGGHQLDAAEFGTDLVGITLTDQNNSFTWNINPDGTTTSAANDGSYSEDTGKWHIVNGEYCRTSPSFKVGEERCSSVYELAGRHYFGVPGSDTDLNNWNVAAL